MNIQEKLFELRDDELVSISAQEKKELLEICPNYYKISELEKLITGNPPLENAFEEFCSNTHTAASFFNKNTI
ncbi:MAG: hypothetical protein E7314_05290 [Clostridiales bacterium]|nr:hypothetical protein [Clostridiales bacterium]